MIRETKGFRSFGLDSDTDIDFLQNGSRNIDKCGFIYGKYDTIIPRKVPTLISKTLPSGTNTVIGIKEDKENKAAIYFIHNSNNNHSIIRINSNNTFTNIIYSQSALNFSLSYPIYSIDLIGDGTDTELSWTDGYNKPRAINIQNFISGSYSTIDESVLNRERPSPVQSPLNSGYGTNASNIFNNVRGKQFQFSYTYVYDNKQESAFSHYSCITDVNGDSLSDGLDFAIGRASGDISYHNYIQLRLYVDWDNVTEIKLYFRVLDVGSGAYGNWNYYDTITPATPYVDYEFYNNKASYPIDEEFPLVLFDNVPDKALAQAAINNNRISYGGITTGKDSVTPDVDFEIGYYLADETVYGGSTFYTQADTVTINTASSGNLDTGSIPNVRNMAYRIYALFTDGTKEQFDLIGDYDISPSGGSKDTEPIVDYFVAEINDKTANSLTASKVDADTIQIANASGQTVRLYLYWYYPQRNYATLSDNATHIFAIRYYENSDKSGRCYTTEDMSVVAAKGGTDYVHRLVFTINHLPPTWANYWQILWGGCNVVQRFTVPICVNNTYSAETLDVSSSGANTVIDLEQAKERFIGEFSDEIDPGFFNVQAGDFLRVRGHSQDAGLNGEENDIADYDETRILNVDVDGKITVKTLNLEQTVGTWNTNSFTYIEIVRYANSLDSDNSVYYEVGETMPIITSGGIKYHGSNDLFSSYSLAWSGGGIVTVQDQTAVLPAVGVAVFGNDYNVFTHTFTEQHPSGTTLKHRTAWMILNSQSMFYPSYQTYKGRYGIVDNAEESKYLNSLIYSGTFNNDSLDYNQLNKFNSELVPLNDIYGKVYYMIEMGYSLYVFQRSKITPIELNRQTVEQDGQTMVVSTNVVLGSQRPLVYDFGTVFPGSITKWGNNLYWYDPLNLSVFRLGQDGLNDISVGMKKYFKDLTDTITSNGYSNYIVRSLYDKVTESYVLIIRDVTTSANSFSISYHLPSGRWICTENYKREGGVSLAGNKVFSFVSGGIYEHHTSAADYEEAYIDITFSSIGHQLFNAIEVESTYNWDMSDDPSVWVDTEDVTYQDPDNLRWYNGKMQSLIPKWKRINGKYKASFLRNNLKKDGTAGDLVKLYNGERLSGKTLTLRLKSEQSSNENRLKYISILKTPKQGID